MLVRKIFHNTRTLINWALHWVLHWALHWALHCICWHILWRVQWLLVEIMLFGLAQLCLEMQTGKTLPVVF